MLGGPGEAVTAWSRAMVRRCCLPAPGSSRRQTLTPKSCVLRVVRHTQLRQQRARVVHRHVGGPAAGRNQTVVLLYLLAAVVLRPPAGIRLGMWETTLPSSPPRRQPPSPQPGWAPQQSTSATWRAGLAPAPRSLSAVAALGGDQRSRPGGDRSRRADPRVRQRGQPPPAEIRSRVRARCAVPARQELIRTRRQRPRRGSSPGVDASFHTPAAFGTSQRLSGSTFV